jgi:hypothetical protein
MPEAAPVGALFDLGCSSEVSNVAVHKDAYVGEAIQADVLRGSCR